MSQENVELVRRGIETINQGGLRAALELLDSICDPEAEFRAVGRLPDLDAVLRGPEAIKGYFTQLFEAFDWHVAPEEFIDAGDRVVVVAQQIGRGRGSGVKITDRIVLVYGVQDGKMTSLDAYRTREEALEAVGLRE
jgi:ketosteroid isomerase-like protein